MKKEVFKSSIFIFLILATLTLFSTLAFASLICEVKQSACSQANLFHLSSQTNAHAEPASETGYNWNVCCELQSDILSTNCANPQANIVNLSSSTDAHVEIPGQTNYKYGVCLSANTGTLSCATKQESCAAEETCIFSQSGATNAHAADCITNPYDWRTCCTYFPSVLGSTCEDDCTYTDDNLIHKECDGINGCEFCNSALGCGFCDKQKVADSCDLAQPGWLRAYYDDTPARCSNGCVIECAEGCPKEKIKVTITCEYENLIKVIKLVQYKGKLTKLTVVTCG